MSAIEQSLNKSESDLVPYCFDDINVLVAYGSASTATVTVVDHLAAFKKYLPFETHYLNVVHNRSDCELIDSYDVIIIHYTCCLQLENYASERLLTRIADADAVKILFAQDEYDNTNQIIKRANQLKCQLYYTCVPENLFAKVFGGRLDPTIELIQTLTGYVTQTHQLYAANLSLQKNRKRTIEVAYKGRPLHPKYGYYGWLKWSLGQKLKKICDEKNIDHDITTTEGERIYWQDWIDLLHSSKSMLVTPSGSGVFDYKGSLRGDLDRRYGSNIFDKYHTIVDELADLDWKEMGQVSPRLFEIMAYGVVPLVVGDKHPSVLIADQNYIAVDDELENISEVFAKLSDISFVNKIVEKNYEFIGQDDFTYRKFIGELEFRIRRLLVKPKQHSFWLSTIGFQRYRLRWPVSIGDDWANFAETSNKAIKNSTIINQNNWLDMPGNSPRFFRDENVFRKKNISARTFKRGKDLEPKFIAVSAQKVRSASDTVLRNFMFFVMKNPYLLKVGLYCLSRLPQKIKRKLSEKL